jgi:hypothetical protein
VSKIELEGYDQILNTKLDEFRTYANSKMHDAYRHDAAWTDMYEPAGIMHAAAAAAAWYLGF